MPNTITKALAGGALLALASCGVPPNSPPSSVEEAYRHHNRPTDKWFDLGRPYADQPGNLRAEDMSALLSGTVLVDRDFDTRSPRHRDYRPDGLNVFFFGPNGKVGVCASSDFYHDDHALSVGHYEPAVRRTEGKLSPVLAVSGTPAYNPELTVEKQDGFEGRLYSLLYDPEMGEVLVFVFSAHKLNPRNSWYKRYTGHLQERLPASVYTLCPDLPPAEDLGFEVNAAQTATGYRELVKQDPGRRILRPDLVTPDARLTYR